MFYYSFFNCNNQVHSRIGKNGKDRPQPYLSHGADVLENVSKIRLCFVVLLIKILMIFYNIVTILTPLELYFPLYPLF